MHFDKSLFVCKLPMHSQTEQYKSEACWYCICSLNQFFCYTESGIDNDRRRCPRDHLMGLYRISPGEALRVTSFRSKGPNRANIAQLLVSYAHIQGKPEGVNVIFSSHGTTVLHFVLPREGKTGIHRTYFRTGPLPVTSV
jgi:hypothetical protein